MTEKRSHNVKWRCFGCKGWKKANEFMTGDRKLCSGCQSSQRIRSSYLNNQKQEYNGDSDESEEIDENLN